MGLRVFRFLRVSDARAFQAAPARSRLLVEQVDTLIKVPLVREDEGNPHEQQERRQRVNLQIQRSAIRTDDALEHHIERRSSKGHARHDEIVQRSHLL